MNNNHGSTPFDGSNSSQPANGEAQGQWGQQGYPQNGYPQNGPQGGAQHSGYQQGHPQQQWQQPEPPKKKNFFVRHKILTGLLALCIVGGIAAAAGGNKSDSNSSTSSSTGAGSDKKSDAKSEDKKDDTKDALPAVGQPVTDGKFTFTVTKVERGIPSVGGEFMNEKAQGAFTLVHITVKNTGDKAQSMFADNQKAYDAAGVGYEANSTASLSVEGNDAFFSEVNPGNVIKGVLVFDAPKGTKLTKIRLHDSMFSNGVEASL